MCKLQVRRIRCFIDVIKTSLIQNHRNYNCILTSAMENFELVKQGAESRIHKGIYLGKLAVAKERFVKKYRHPDLDAQLTKERMKSESRAIMRCKEVGICTPALYLVDFKRRTIFMEYFEFSITVKDFILTATDCGLVETVSLKIGEVIGKMHENNIIHGDLTTSNILLVNKKDMHKFDDAKDLELVLIDFGLAKMGASTEDKGVDLYVLERALLSTHSDAEDIFKNILKSYQKQYKNGVQEVISKYEEVRARGRKRTMVG